MKAIVQVSLWGVLAVMMGCALVSPKETLYLRSALDRATQEEVKQRLGPLALTGSTKEESVWVYQIREEQPGSRITAPGTWCDEYALTFDGQGILRRWTHRSQFHGGELMPTYCVSDGFKRAS